MTEFKQLPNRPSLYRCGCSYAYVPDHANVSLLDLKLSWSYGGRYLFCPPNTTTSDTLYEKILSYLASHPMALFSWVENPDTSTAEWRVMAINLSKLDIDILDHYIEPFVFPFPEELHMSGEEYLYTDQRHIVTYTEEGIAFRNVNGGHAPSIYQKVTPLFRFHTYPSEFRILIDANGGSASSTSSEADYTDIVLNIIGFRFYSFQPGPERPAGEIPLQMLQTDFFSYKSISSPTKINYLNLYDPQQTYFSVKNYSGSNLNQSVLLTNEGLPLQVNVTDDSCMVYERGIKSLEIDAGGNLIAQPDIYLTYSGHFTVSGGDTILCGLSGTEYVKLKQGQTHEIEFVPHQNAFVDLGKSLEGGELLSSLSQTAWIRLPEDIEYYDPPETAGLFTFGNDTQALTPKNFKISRFYGRAPFAPMGLYGSLPASVDFTQVRALENRLYRTRQAILSNGAMQITPMESQPLTICTTPQGLLVGVNEYGDWYWVGLAQEPVSKQLRSAELDAVCMRDCMACAYGGNGTPSTPAESYKCPYSMFNNAPVDAVGAPSLYIEHISARLRELLHKKDIFVTFESPAQFLHNALPCSTFSMRYGCWTFEMHPHRWITDSGNGNTIMILKYAKHQTLRELMADSPILRQTLSQAMDEAGKVKTGYEDLLRITDDPDFQGVLFLNCPVTLDQKNAPDSLNAALSGDGNVKLVASYLVLAANQICNDNGTMKMKPSSAYGKLHYASQAVLEPTGEQDENAAPPAAKYHVSLIDLNIKNSAIADFRLEAELFINTLFGSSLTVPNGQYGECLRLIGTCQEGKKIGTDGNSADIVSAEYVFALREKVRCALQASAMSAVQMETVQLATETIKATEQDKRDTYRSVMTLGGRMLFIEDAACDLFGYGESAEQPDGSGENAGLLFDGLRVILPETGGAQIDVGMLSFHQSPDRSDARPKSFAACFASKVEQLLFDVEKTPDDMGYRSITCPVDQGELQKHWAGVVWNIELGKLGALAKDPVAIRLLTAWSADETGEKPALYIGVKLPEVLGGEGLDFQGLIKLGFHSISLEAGEWTNTEKTTAEEAERTLPARRYTLVLNNFALRLLGISLPPGSNKIFLVSDGKGIGWYAGYGK